MNGYGPVRSNRYVRGFSLIEVVAFLMIIGMTAYVGLPYLFKKTGSKQPETFVQRLGDMVAFARSQSVAEGVMHKVAFDLDGGTVRLERASTRGEPADPTQATFVGEPRYSGNKALRVPADVTLENIEIDGISERRSGGTQAVWFFIDTQGIPQPVRMQIIVTNDEQQEYTYVLNPFTATFSPASTEA